MTNCSQLKKTYSYNFKYKMNQLKILKNLKQKQVFHSKTSTLQHSRFYFTAQHDKNDLNFVKYFEAKCYT